MFLRRSLSSKVTVRDEIETLVYDGSLRLYLQERMVHFEQWIRAPRRQRQAREPEGAVRGGVEQRGWPHPRHGGHGRGQGQLHGEVHHRHGVTHGSQKPRGWDVACSMFRTALRLGWCLSEAVCGPGVRSECMCRYELRLGGLSNLVSQRRSLSLYLHLRSWDKLFLQVSANLVCIRHHRSQWQLWWVPKLGPGGAWPVASQTCLWHHNDFANGQN